MVTQHCWSASNPGRKHTERQIWGSCKSSTTKFFVNSFNGSSQFHESNRDRSFLYMCLVSKFTQLSKTVSQGPIGSRRGTITLFALFYDGMCGTTAKTLLIIQVWVSACLSCLDSIQLISSRLYQKLTCFQHIKLQDEDEKVRTGSRSHSILFNTTSSFPSKWVKERRNSRRFLF